jgi:hypothetical protein
MESRIAGFKDGKVILEEVKVSTIDVSQVMAEKEALIKEMYAIEAKLAEIANTEAIIEQAKAHYTQEAEEAEQVYQETF